MADDPKPDPANPDPEPEPKPGDPPDPDPDAGAKKALEAERKAAREAARQVKDLQAKLKEFEDRDKSDAEKAAEKLSQAEKRAEEAEAKALRLQVASDKGLSSKQLKYLTGTSQEELEANADQILEDFPEKEQPKPPPSRRPSADLGGGTDPTKEPTDVKSLVDSIPPTA